MANPTRFNDPKALVRKVNADFGAMKHEKELSPAQKNRGETILPGDHFSEILTDEELEEMLKEGQEKAPNQ